MVLQYIPLLITNHEFKVEVYVVGDDLERLYSEFVPIAVQTGKAVDCRSNGPVIYSSEGAANKGCYLLSNLGNQVVR